MKYLTLIICLLSFGLVLAQGTAKKTVKTTIKDPEKAPKKAVVKQSLSEFRKIRWGTRMDSILINGAKPVFVKATDFGKTEPNAFYIENDDMTIGTISLQRILYVFTPDSSLSRVVLMGEKKKFGEMKYIIAYKFGEPVIEDKKDGYDCVWDLDECRVRQSFFNDQQIFTVNFYSDYENSNSKKVNRTVDDF
jgi:hypothetical protein